MGCDIHAHIEYNDDGDWEYFTPIHLSRWYELFGHLAGVRRDYVPVVAPRGVPDDMDHFTMWDYKEMGIDANHASWLTLDEMKQVAAKCTNLEFDAVIAAMESFAKADCNVRFIFWFDN